VDPDAISVLFDVSQVAGALEAEEFSRGEPPQDSGLQRRLGVATS
jgi:hypothetical protein